MSVKKIVIVVMMALSIGGLMAMPAIAEGEDLCADDSGLSDAEKAAIGCGNKTLCDDPDIDPALKDAAGCLTGDDRDKTIMPVVTTIIEVVMGVIGVIAVGVIIYGGVTYTISTGDSAKTTKAKNIILYGVIGLVVALLAYTLVTFVSKSLGA